MMRKIGFWLVGMALLLGASSLFAASSGPANVLVVYVSGNAQSVKLAKYYQAARGIPDANLLPLATPTSWNADGNTDIVLSDYNQYIYNPLIIAIAGITAAGGRIDYVVLCRNLPYNVAAEGITMTVDGALMCPNGVPQGETEFALFNDFYKFGGSFADYQAGNGLNPNSKASQNSIDETIPFLVTRLDGPTWTIAQGLVDSALKPRLRTAEVFLNGGNNQNFTSLDSNIAVAASALTAAGIANLTATDKFTRPSFKMQAYFSYGELDGTFDETKFGSLLFGPGSIAEVASFGTAFTLRSFGNWADQIATLLSHGLTGAVAHTGTVTATSAIGYYYADGFAQPDIYTAAYLIDGQNLADSLFAALPYIGYTQLVVGDPLCTYSGPGFAGVALNPHGMVAASDIGGMGSWNTTGTKSSTQPGTIHSNSAVGGTNSWINGGGGGNNTTSHGW